jgi:ABC-type Fe3+-hydroxamate transport system substrate-binding protein
MGVIRISDDRKRELTFGSAPGRVVSLVPSDTYNVAALGCGAALVARTDYCELPEDLVKRLPSIGGTKNPKVEAIIDLAPDLVIANQEENSKGDIEKLINRGLRVYVAFPKRASEGIAHLARLARIFRIEREPAARTLLKRGYDVIREAEEARKRVDGIRTFCPIWMKPLMTINGETFISDVLHLAGAENVFADRKRR